MSSGSGARRGDSTVHAVKPQRSPDPDPASMGQGVVALPEESTLVAKVRKPRAWAAEGPTAMEAAERECRNTNAAAECGRVRPQRVPTLCVSLNGVGAFAPRSGPNTGSRVSRKPAPKSAHQSWYRARMLSRSRF